MDINEIDIKMRYRHPWERSRTNCLLWELRPFFNESGDECIYIDLGAGDQYFDDMLLSSFPLYHPIAVDIGYTEEALKKIESRVRCSEKICTAKRLSDLGETQADFALMMDSLEYMDDDVLCLKELLSHVKPGGYVFLTLPAYRFLFSEFDNIVRGKRRYDKKDIRRVIKDVPGLELKRIHCFYTSLFLVRLVQKYSGVTIDPEHKVISGWAHGDKSLLTRLTMGVLALDYRVNALLGRIKLDFPGLSMLVICKKAQNNTEERR